MTVITTVGTDRGATLSPRIAARVAGVFYCLIIVMATFADVFVRGKLVVSNDALTTASNILAHEQMYRMGGVADVIAFVCDVAVALLFYELFKPVSVRLSLLAAFFRLIHTAIVAVNTLNHFAPLVLLGGGGSFAAFGNGQLHSLALLFLKLHQMGYNIALVFFAFQCLLIGYLIVRSTFLPAFLGVLTAIAGLCYLTNCFMNFLSPALAAHLFPYILGPAGVAELVLCLWLLVMGVNSQRWMEQAGARGV